jgi:TetR/AcrR family transcriptional regulator, repressor for uid operon
MAGASLIERALGAAASEAPPEDRMSERILDAALDLVAASGLRRLTMDDVAARAGVGRMTVYRRFGERERLIDALATREVQRCLAALDAAVDPGDPVAEQIADGFEAAIRLARTHPLLERFARYEPETALAALNADGAAIFAMSRAFTASLLVEAQKRGEVGDLDPDQAAEILVRLGVSFVLIPSSVLPLDDETRVREVARRLIAPILAGA